MQTQSVSSFTKKHDEEILVIKRKHLANWQGLKKTSLEDFLELVNVHKEFHPRSRMETDLTYKQIIPYLIFKHGNSIFLIQRAAQAGEQRLKNKYSLGIGGHIRKEDLKGTVIDWAQREFHEEVTYDGNYQVNVLGLLNDDSNPVGEVHLGCVLLLEGDSPAIRIKSELQSGILLDLAACKSFYPSMEGWSQTIFDYLEREYDL